MHSMKKLIRITLIAALALLIIAALGTALAEAPDHNHFAQCRNPGVCAQCGEPYDGDNILHEVRDNTYHYDETYHWYICDYCHQEAYKYEHTAACNNLGVCRDCGAAYTGRNISHQNIDWDNW